MNILAVDTATQYISVSLYFNNQMSSRFHNKDIKSSSLILPMIKELISDISLDDIDAIVYGKGPGAFTGVRVGISVVQGLALAHNIPTLGFSSLETLEYGAKIKFNTPNIISSIDARMNEVYLRYEGQNILIKPEDAYDVIAMNTTEYIGVGSGFNSYGNFMRCKQIMPDFHPLSENLIYLALENPKFNHNLANPLYLRNNIAQKSVKS